jgi:hypothetical protein
MSVNNILDAIYKCLKRMDYLNAYYVIVGVYDEDLPDHIALWEKLLGERDKYEQALISAKRMQGIVVMPGEANILKAYEITLEKINENIKLWDKGSIRVLCPEDRLKGIALQIKKNGSVMLAKDEVEEIFDMTHIIDFWSEIPKYTTFIFGAGIAMSSPEYDMFESLCWCYNEAFLSHEKALSYKTKIESLTFDEDDLKLLGEATSVCIVACRQVIINSLLLIEAFLNSLAYSYLSNPTKALSDEQRLFLNEKRRDERGKEITKFVPLHDKLHDWVRMISLNSRTFDKGKNPYQSFMKIKGHRDSIVHFSAKKIDNFNAINFEIAHAATLTAIEIVEKISEFISPDEHNIKYPFWLTRPGNDGMFHLSRILTLPRADVNRG